ncbi:hypothetical protein LOTGIDRAFT_233215 [Lottia gigantea]|uniref:EGF-like domain-containing protein n=1 Tax=Lottia gigantea TaxID=225164 RepID=V4AFL2_LOTGI|nr:hypothetical protein LOTGIDRAFT_233215 [Lottia gigantea]ESO92166.1 hypothetical protein LOTGIDRAFT_233215 [Lottia gigantea]
MKVPLLLSFLALGLNFPSLCEAGCPSNCHYNGKCNVRQSTCHCYEGFTGSDCNTACGCNGRGTCLKDNTCKCDEGWIYSGGQCIWDCHCSNGIVIVLMVSDIFTSYSLTIVADTSCLKQCIWDCHCSNGAKCIGPGECGCSQPCKYGDCRNGQCQCWNGYKGVECSQYDPTIMTNNGIKMGMNLGGISYYSSELKFVDIAKQSQEWITQRDGQNSWDTKEHDIIQWTTDGYPASLPDGMRVAKLVYRNFGVHEENGQYAILWDGDGEVSIKLTKYKILSNQKGRMVVELNHLNKGGVLLVVGNINPKNPLRNLRMIAPGYEQIYNRFPFHPVFLENLRRYSELRFMDFYATNGHGPEPTTWSSRYTDTFHTQAGKQGGALEHMIDLSNRLGTNPWFCIPHAADDDYITKFATMVRDKLRPDLKIYVEYSNEVWNGIFRQTKYTREQGMALKLDSRDFKAGLKYYNKRSTEMILLWNKVFGSNAKDRVFGVWAWQTGYQDYYRQAIEDLGTRVQTFRNIAITGYFDCSRVADKHAKELPQMNMTQIQQYCKAELPKKEAEFKHYMDMAKAHGVELAMYEGGPGVMESSAIAHFGQANKATTEKAIAFNKDIHMEESVMDVLKLWNKVVVNDPATKHGGFFNYFSYTSTPSKYGSWGMLEYTGQDPKTVAKFRGVQRFLTSIYSTVPRGPRCSFIKNSAMAYGCYNTAGKFDCGMTDDNGRTWNNFNVPERSPGDTLVLDGYNKKKDLVYIRVTDNLGANTYHVYNLKSQQWTSSTNFLYYTELADRDILPPQSNSNYLGLDSHFNC